MPRLRKPTRAPDPEAVPQASHLSITQLAAEFGVTPRALRFYEEYGLLKPTRLGNERRYSPTDRGKLKLITCLTKIGVPVAELSGFIRENRDGSYALAIDVTEVRKRLAHQASLMVDLENAISLLMRWEAKIEKGEPLP